MANPWKNIIDKLSARKHTMKESDWAAMQEKIAAHPELQHRAGNRRGAYIAGAFVLAGIMAVALFWFTGNEDASKPQTPIQNSNGNTQSLPNEKIISTTDSTLEKQTEKPGPNYRIRKKANQKGSGNSVNNKPAKKRASVAFISINRKPSMPVVLGKASNERPISAPYRKLSHINSQDSKNGGDFIQDINKKDTGVNSHVLTTDEDKSSPGNTSGKLSGSDSEAAKPEIRLQTDSLLTLKPKTTPEEATPAPFVRPGTGIEIYSLQWASGFSSQFRPHGWQQWQTGADFYFQRNNLMLNTGLYYGERWFNRDDSYTKRNTSVDSTWIRNIETRNELEITKIWVIDSFFAGHYEIDTSIVQVIDTTYDLQVDSTSVTTNIKKETRIVESFVAIPLTVGYRYNLGRWDLLGNVGAVFRQVTTASPERTNRKSSFGTDLLVRPEFRYRLTKQWDIYTRVSLRYPIVQNSELPKKSPSYGGQIGIAIRFDQN